MDAGLAIEAVVLVMELEKAMDRVGVINTEYIN